MSLGTLLKSIKDQVSDHLFAQMSDLPPAPIIYNPFLVTDKCIYKSCLSRRKEKQKFGLFVSNLSGNRKQIK